MPTTLLNYWPAWLGIAIATLVAVNQAITESEKFANTLGGWARKMHARAQKRHRMDTVEFNEAVRDAVADERTRWENDEARSLKIVEGRLEYVTKITENQQTEMGALSFQVRCMTAYTEYEADWHHRLRLLILRANQNGGEIAIQTLPDHMAYYEFETMCKQKGNLNWRTWGLYA